MEIAFSAAGTGERELRQLQPQWNAGMITASLAISLLGAFTPTQLMCQARMSVRFSSVLVWTILGSLTFGFCSIWCLHFVAMLACELDLKIGIDVPLTLLSSALAVFFTFASLASDLLWARYTRKRRKGHRPWRRNRAAKARTDRPSALSRENSSKPLLGDIEQDGADWRGRDDDLEESVQVDSRKGMTVELNGDAVAGLHTPPESPRPEDENVAMQDSEAPLRPAISNRPSDVPTLTPEPEPYLRPILSRRLSGRERSLDSCRRSSSEYSTSRRSSSFIGSSSSSYGLGNLMNIAYRGASPAKNTFIATGEALCAGCTMRNIVKSFLWSLAITSMHYVGIAALRIPDGHITLDPAFVILSALISWIVCLVGCILMSQIETNLAQQCLFSVVASTGVAAMHFTGMRAVTFWSHAKKSEDAGYPPELAVAIVSVAIITCMAANGLLAHVATVSRNKLAEIVTTRKKLWRTMAQKENAEAATAARSDFIASASHEIRTPLHHLTGYADLLARTELTEEGRILLFAIQRATKTLSLITNNVLDWSKLERDGETPCRPVALDMRTVCESILVLLPNRDDEAEVALMVVVAPSVPQSLYLDETYIHRILMNLLSNAIKFTRSGYILLLVEIDAGKLIATVRDTGSGVPPSFLPQLFEPFKQAQTRGSQRGTGLGLSITLGLLHRMQGTIEVQSKHPEAEDVEPGETGSTFTIRIPMQSSSMPQSALSSSEPLQKIAIFHDSNPRCLEGLCSAWEKYGFEVTMVNEISGLLDCDWKYIWADLNFLEHNPAHLQQLLDQEQWVVLVPYDTQEALERIPGILSAPNFVPLQKPLIWHTFQQRVAAATDPSRRGNVARTVRFAPKVGIVDHQTQEHPEEPIAKGIVVLLVEDNPINQKLGRKMLASLKYEVKLADDGEEAVEQIKKLDATIDVILMDQSMPRKDGVTATKEIRAMEAAGILSRRRPIIAITAVVNNEAQALFKAAGADDFLPKPLSLAKLEEVLATYSPT